MLLDLAEAGYDDEKLDSMKEMRTLIELKYNTISDAAAEFGSPQVIRDTFIGFQKYLYELR